MSDFIYINMPKVFFSDDENSLFKRCYTCETNLLHEGQVYVVEKSYRNDDLLFEYAQCMECLEKETEAMSYPSRGMREYWDEKYLRITERFERLSKKAPRDVEPWINICAVTGRHKRELEQHQLLALCQGNKLILCGFPFMVSEEALEQLGDLMSRETREEWGRFARDVLDLTPETAGNP